MQSHSDAFHQAVLQVQEVVATVEWRYGASPWQEIPFTDGSVTCDRKSVTRWACNVKVPPEVAIEIRGMSPYGGQLRIRRGIIIPRVGPELMGWGVYRIDKIDITLSGSTITGYSMEKAISDARFLTPRRIGGFGTVDAQGNIQVQGLTYKDVIKTLVNEAVPNTAFIWRTPEVGDTVHSFIEERDRWAVLDSGGSGTSIATAIGGEMYFDGNGNFVVQDTPSLADPVAWVLDDVQYPVLVEPTRTLSRESVFNVLVAMGQATDGTKPVGPGFAWDNKSDSPTYAGPDPVFNPQLSTQAVAPFGIVPRFYSSPLLKTKDACIKAARSLVGESIGLNKVVTFTMASNSALEPGDIVSLDDELHIIDSWTSGLRSGTMTGNTRASKDTLSDVTIGAA